MESNCLLTEFMPEDDPEVLREAYESIRMAEAAGGTLYIFHMSTGAASDIVKEAQSRGIPVHAETGPHYLLLDDELFKRKDGHHYATCPPIRKPADQEKLWERLTDGTVEVLATDTCTFTSEQKAMWKGDYKSLTGLRKW